MYVVRTVDIPFILRELLISTEVTSWPGVSIVLVHTNHLAYVRVWGWEIIH